MIHTTMGKVLSAYVALNRVRNKVKGKTALDLFRLKNAMKDSVDFISEEEMKLVNEHGGAVTETGTIIIADKDKRAAFMTARKELDMMECDVEMSPPVVNMENNPDITMEDIEQLDGFVEFK